MSLVSSDEDDDDEEEEAEDDELVTGEAAFATLDAAAQAPK